jgi:hypothetical protein
MMDLMDFPMEVLTLIIMLVSDGTELSELSFIKRNTVKNATDKNLTLISPKTLCILSRVCKSFRTEFTSNVYWIPLMVRDFRKGKEYKRPHKNCRKTYMNKLILRDIEPKLRLHNMILIWNQKQLSIQTNNADIYMEEIQDAVVNPDFDNQLYKYRVGGLQRVELLEPTIRTLKHDFGNLDYEGYLNSTIQSNRVYPINFYSMYSFRNNCLNYINLSNIRIKEMQGNIEKHQRTVDGIKLI